MGLIHITQVFEHKGPKTQNSPLYNSVHKNICHKLGMGQNPLFNTLQFYNSVHKNICHKLGMGQNPLFNTLQFTDIRGLLTIIL